MAGFWESLLTNPAWQSIGQTLGGAAEGGAKGQLSAGQLALQGGQLDLNRWIAQEMAKREMADLMLKAPSALGKQAVFGNWMAYNPKPATVDPVTHRVTYGGFSPANMSEQTRQMGQGIAAGAETGMKQMSPLGMGGSLYQPGAMPAAPEMPGESFWQKIGSYVGPGMQLLPEIAKLFGKGKQTPGTGGGDGGEMTPIDWSTLEAPWAAPKLTPAVTTDWRWQDPYDVNRYIPPPKETDWKW